MRLADGTLEIYYSNESPDLAADEGLGQRIEMIRSGDGGLSWSDAMVVSQDAGRRNGMPSALALSNGGVACAQEVVGAETAPWIALTRSGSLTGRFSFTARAKPSAANKKTWKGGWFNRDATRKNKCIPARQSRLDFAADVGGGIDGGRALSVRLNVGILLHTRTKIVYDAQSSRRIARRVYQQAAAAQALTTPVARRLN